MEIEWRTADDGWVLGPRLHDAHLIEIHYRYPEVLSLTFRREDGTCCLCELRDIAHCTIDMQDIDILFGVYAWETDKIVRGRAGQDEAVRTLYKKWGFERAHEFIETDDRKRGADLLLHFTFSMEGEIACRARQAVFMDIVSRVEDSGDTA